MTVFTESFYRITEILSQSGYSQLQLQLKRPQLKLSLYEHTLIKYVFHDQAKDLTVTKTEVPAVKPELASAYTFGKLFTDHMFQVDWDLTSGWGKPRIVPYEPLRIDTTATSLHYGISAFEGISVVRNVKNGKAQAFRTQNNLNSLIAASEHLDMPTFDTNELLECLKRLVVIDKSWLPDLPNDTQGQLYLRLAHIATDEVLGVRTARKTKLFGIMNPTTLKPKTFRLKCATNVFKNWPLGHGNYRIASNFGPLVPTIQDAKVNGFDDVLWILDGFIKEMTTINVFALIKSRYGVVELITPPDDGCIFNGSVRKSILHLAPEIYREKGIRVVERQLSVSEMVSAAHEDRFQEFFGCATSCNIQPVSRIVYEDEVLIMNQGSKGYPISNYLNNKLTSIMTGPSDHEWITPFE